MSAIARVPSGGKLRKLTKKDLPYSIRIFDSRLFTYNKIFKKKLLLKLIAHIFTLLLAPFAYKLVNKSQHIESLNIRKNSEIDHIFLQNQWFVDIQAFFEILTNLYAKGAKRSVKMYLVMRMFLENIFAYFQDVWRTWRKTF